MKSQNELDQLLEDSNWVDAPNAEVLSSARNVVTAEAEATAARAAKIVHLRRRHRRLTIGVAAAAVAGLVAVPLLSQGGSTPTPPAAAPPMTHVAPPVQARYRTVAQVINAAAAHTGSTDPTTDAYWKVSSTYVGWGCELGGVPIGAPPSTKPTPTICHTVKGTRTAWTATAGGTGVLEDSQMHDRPSLGPGTIVVDGQNLTWRQFNARSWTEAQLETLINYSGTADVPGYSTRSWYSLKDAFDLMAESPISPAIRTQLWKIVEKIPGARLVGQATDHAGRTGWEISYSDPTDGTMTFIIDTTTGMLLESGGSLRASGGVETHETYLSAEPTTTAPSVVEYHGQPPTKLDCKRLAPAGPKLTQCLKAAKG